DQIPTEKLQPLIKQKPVFAEADVAKSDEEPQADIPQSTEEQAPRQRQKRVVKQRSRFSILYQVAFSNTNPMWTVSLRPTTTLENYLSECNLILQDISSLWQTKARRRVPPISNHLEMAVAENVEQQEADVSQKSES